MVEKHYSVERWSPALALLIDQLSRQDIVPDLSQMRLAAPSQNPPPIEDAHPLEILFSSPPAIMHALPLTVL